MIWAFFIIYMKSKNEEIKMKIFNKLLKSPLEKILKNLNDIYIYLYNIHVRNLNNISWHHHDIYNQEVKFKKDKIKEIKNQKKKYYMSDKLRR